MEIPYGSTYGMAIALSVSRICADLPSPESLPTVTSHKVEREGQAVTGAGTVTHA